MAAMSGTAGSVVYISGGTALVAGMSEWRLDVAAGIVETTEFGQNWNTNIPSTRSFTGSFSGNFDTANAIQGSVVSAMLGGSAVNLRLYASATKYWNIGTAYVNGMAPAISQKGKGDVQFSFTGSDALTLV